jgi:hypothetical protein
MSARIFSDAGANGSAGFFIEPLGPDAALQAGDSGVIIAPADPSAARLNLGVRSLEAGASFLITVRSKNGGHPRIEWIENGNDLWKSGKGRPPDPPPFPLSHRSRCYEQVGKIPG